MQTGLVKKIFYPEKSKFSMYHFFSLQICCTFFFSIYLQFYLGTKFFRQFFQISNFLLHHIFANIFLHQTIIQFFFSNFKFSPPPYFCKYFSSSDYYTVSKLRKWSLVRVTIHSGRVLMFSCCVLIVLRVYQFPLSYLVSRSYALVASCNRPQCK